MVFCRINPATAVNIAFLASTSPYINWLRSSQGAASKTVIPTAESSLSLFVNGIRSVRTVRANEAGKNIALVLERNAAAIAKAAARVTLQSAPRLTTKTSMYTMTEPQAVTSASLLTFIALKVNWG